MFNDATGEVEDLKIKMLYIETSGKNHFFNSDNISSLNWNISWDPNVAFSSKCFRLTIPENITKEGINVINFMVEKAKKINILFFAVGCDIGDPKANIFIFSFIYSVKSISV